MSTKISNSTRNNENNFDVFEFNTDNRFFNNDKNSLHLRDQLNKFISECFIRGTKDESHISSNFSSIIDNNNCEKIKNLESHIANEEKRIAELEKAKQQKLVKIEDLRKIIERIASEDCYDKSNFVVIKNKKFMARERTWSNSSNKLERNVSTVTNSTAHVSDISLKGDSETEELEGACDGEGNQGADRGNINNRSICKPSFSSSSSGNDHLQNCLLYWQDNVYPHTFKA